MFLFGHVCLYVCRVVQDFWNVESNFVYDFEVSL